MCSDLCVLLLASTVEFNECMVNNGGCAQHCFDTYDSFFCNCSTGFSLDTDGVSCNGIDFIQCVCVCNG